MKRTGLMCVTVVATTMIMVISGCSKPEGAKTSSSEQSVGHSAAVGTGGAGANLDSDDFVRDVALKNMAEAELSRLAVDKAADPNIRAFAQMMIAEHGAAGDVLKTVVSERGFEWPAQLDDKDRKTADELKKKQGVDFDRAYTEAMIKGHQDLAAKLESRLDVQSVADWKTAAAGRTRSKALPEPKTEITDVQVRPNKSDNAETMKINQWAANTYPIAQKHLDTARSLENATSRTLDRGEESRR